MQDLSGLLKVLVYATMGICVLWAIAAVTLKSLFRAALAFTGVLLGLAGIYLALHAEFLAVVQVFVYVGAVMTLIIFAIMLTERFTDQTLTQNNKQSFPGAIAAVVFIVLISKVILNTPWPLRHLYDASLTVENTQKIGTALLSQFVFPFEVLAVILTAVVIGAVVIAKKEESC